MGAPEEVRCKAERYACAWPIHQDLQQNLNKLTLPSVSTHYHHYSMREGCSAVWLCWRFTSSGASLHTIAMAAQAATRVVQMEVR